MNIPMRDRFFPSFIRTVPSVAESNRSHVFLFGKLVDSLARLWRVGSYTTDWEFPPAGESPDPEGTRIVYYTRNEI